MSARFKKPVVFWPKENKVGVESLSNVPENSRSVGACTPLKFHVDKKFYPAKIIFISDKEEEIDAAVEEKEKEIETANAAAKERQAQGTARHQRGSKKSKVKDPSVATERDVAFALGSKVPIPKDLEEQHKNNRKTIRAAKVHQQASLQEMDRSAMSEIRRDLFSVKSHTEGEDSNDEDDSDVCAESDDEHETQIDSASNAWCSCSTCKVMKKYDGPVYANFLRDIVSLYERQDSGEVKFLELLRIPPEEKQVELVKGKDVMISSTTKDQLKVHYRNKATSLARETLFALYGKEPFKVLSVTGKGLKKGSFTIPKDVQSVVCSLVNKNTQEAIKAWKGEGIPIQSHLRHTAVFSRVVSREISSEVSREVWTEVSREVYSTEVSREVSTEISKQDSSKISMEEDTNQITADKVISI
ncbi:hypothetical protein ONE63_011496 [Megalurothrips usitatus]|uniref:Uncharacterized protein n=1 Tax=Megalurothrips usitatus TaxID=439358 RepID=A0AAV7X342_9NEOP|nr:hypothetical protein ONE63_011496 [Megalurothrips usitatus]